MSSFLIRIDRSTFRKNPNSGATETKVPGQYHTTVVAREIDGKHARFIAVGPVLFSKDGNSFSGAFRRQEDGSLVEKTFVISGDACGESERVVEFDYTRDVTTVHHMPLPRYLWEYDRCTLLACGYCGEQFRFKDIADDEEGNYICPKCDAIDPCELTFESCDAVAAELGLQ